MDIQRTQRRLLPKRHKHEGKFYLSFFCITNHSSELTEQAISFQYHFSAPSSLLARQQTNETFRFRQNEIWKLMNDLQTSETEDMHKYLT